MVQFKIGSYPIQLRWSFILLILVVINLRLGATGIAIWFVAAFVAILIHELAHAFMVRRSGGIVHQVTIYGLGGVTSWDEKYGSSITWKTRLAISLAGPVAGLVIGLLMFTAIQFGLFGTIMQEIITAPWRFYLRGWSLVSDWGSFALVAFMSTNLLWATINLLPISGFDGSHILRETLERRNPRDGGKLAAWIGIGVAVVAAAYAFFNLSWFVAFVFVMLALNDYARINNQPPPFGNLRN